MAKKQQGKKGVFYPVFYIVIACLAIGVLVFGGIRYFISPSFAVLWEVCPAFGVLLIVSVAGGVAYRKSRRKQIEETKGLIKALTVESEDVSGELTQSINEAREQINQAILEAKKDAYGAGLERKECEMLQAIRNNAVPSSCCVQNLMFEVGARVNCDGRENGAFYDYFPLTEGKLCFAVGNVLSEGEQGVFSLFCLRELVRIFVRTEQSLSNALSMINQTLCKEKEITATLALSIFQPQTGDMRYASAGHFSPVVVGEHYGLLATSSGAPLGVNVDNLYKEEYTQLPPGRTVLYYTDGVASAYNEKREFFGYERLFPALISSWREHLGVEHVLNCVEQAVRAFRGETKKEGFALLALYYPHGVQKTFSVEEKEGKKLVETVGEWLQNDGRKGLICNACEEIFENIRSYAGATEVQFDGKREGDSYYLRFLDDGAPFHPLQSGGEGIQSIRLIHGEIFYRTQEKKNVLTVKFPAREI